MSAISLSTPYIQTFDTLVGSGSGTWTDDVTLSGWYTVRTGTGATIGANDGASNAGNLYSYGPTDSSDRALGSIGSGNAAAGNFFWGVRLVNDTAATITTLNIDYTGEQWRNSGANGPQTVDFQYLIGATNLTDGTWVDFNALDFTSPTFSATAITLDGNAAANRLTVSGSLTDLSLAPGQEIWLRWSDPDHVGADHGLAIDDFTLSTSEVTLTPGISILQTGNTTVAEGGSTDSYGLVLKTQPTDLVVITIAADDQTTLSDSTLTFTPDNWDVAQTITVTAIDDTAVEGAHTSQITHTASSADADYDNVALSPLTVRVIDNDFPPIAVTKIHDIQGDGATFALGGPQTIAGIVVGKFTGTGTLQGFYVQEEDSDSDGNDATSEGIFVYDPMGRFAGDIGSKVQVTGVVAEYTTTNNGIVSSLTELNNISAVNVLGLDALPTATVVNFPLTSAADLERYEGMLITIPETLMVTETYQLGRYGQVTLAAAGDSNQPGTDDRLEQFTQFNAPSVEGYAAYLEAIAARQIVLDDGRTNQDPDPIILGRGGTPLSAANPLRNGDTVTGLTGVLDDRYGAYRIQPTDIVNFVATNERPTSAPAVGGTLTVASFNVLSYFNGNGLGGGFPALRGAQTLAEFTRQRAKTIQAILATGADVVGLMELENDGYGPNSAIQDLVNGLNAIAGAGTYAFINPDTSLATDQITVGMIYQPGKVTLAGAAATMPTGYGSGAFDVVGRKPLAQTFTEIATGEQFTIVVNHLKSKGSSATSLSDDLDAGDGQALSNGTRTRQAQDLASWLATQPTGTSDADYLVLGDLNAYAQEDPIISLKNAGYDDLSPSSAYSYVFDGQWGSLDYILGNSSIASQVTGSGVLHINADEPTALDYNTNFRSASQLDSLYAPDQYRASDHDPIIVGLNLTSAVAVEDAPLTAASLALGSSFGATNSMLSSNAGSWTGFEQALSANLGQNATVMNLNNAGSLVI